jgi:hypothetical protein
MASPLDQCLHLRRLALEHGLNRTVLTVGYPAGYSMCPRLASTGVTEEHPLHPPMGHDSTSDHGTSQACVLLKVVTNERESAISLSSLTHAFTCITCVTP